MTNALRCNIVAPTNCNASSMLSTVNPPSTGTPELVTTTFILSLSGRNREGMLSQVFRPMTTALMVYSLISSLACLEVFGEAHTPGAVRLVTRAKYAISRFRPVQGSVPPKPIPILFVAATMTVNSLDAIGRPDSSPEP